MTKSGGVAFVWMFTILNNKDCNKDMTDRYRLKEFRTDTCVSFYAWLLYTDLVIGRK